MGDSGKHGVNRRVFLRMTAGAAALSWMHKGVGSVTAKSREPNILFVMTDQQRFDTIAALGNTHIYTPNLDRLVARGVTFTNGYSTCPVCVPARLTLRTGCEPPTTGTYMNSLPELVPGQTTKTEERCGPYLARRMHELGYRTFGIGKFHASPWNENLGYDVQLHSEEMYGTKAIRSQDAYAGFIEREHPEYAFIEQLMGERTDMYYMPQTSALPAALGVEAWAADRAVEQIRQKGEKPFFGFVSFVGPHPPFAPPIPFNRMYDPDHMPNPIRGDKQVDLMDEQIRWMNYAIWAEDISDGRARALKARYYGEISYIDQCLGRILDAVEARSDAENTLICFFADHGDHLGDHGAWQKESYFESSCHIPFLVSWPAHLPRNTRNDALVCLTDLFGIATSAAGKKEVREGVDVLGILKGQCTPRDHLIGYYGTPGTPLFKIMVREGDWKYIYMANGGLEQLFNLKDDPNELNQRLSTDRAVADRLRLCAIKAVKRPNVDRALDKDGMLLRFPETSRPLQRIYQFDASNGVTGFPKQPGDVLQKP